MVDFSDHFWGEKNTGFSVLYQNMKNGQLAVKEFSEFLKERVVLEDDYHKHLLKILKQVGNYGNAGTFGPIWLLLKGSLEKVDQTHLQLHQRFQDLLKEVQKYGEEQRHLQKSVKDKERGTFETCNLIQTTTTLLQKAKETYTMRSVELEKLKRENATAKDISRAETKVKKAGDEYRQFVEKYSKVRNEFEEGMTQSSRRFQEIEENHLIKMKNFVIAFITHSESCHVQLSEICSGLKNRMEYMKIVDLLGDFISKCDTGLEKPGLITFEEPDITSLFPPQSNNVSVPSNLGGTPASTPTMPNQSALTPDELWSQDVSGTSPVSPVIPDYSHSLINLRLSSHSTDQTFSPDSVGDILSPLSDAPPVLNSTENNGVVVNSSTAPPSGNSSLGKQSSKMSLFANWPKWSAKGSTSNSSGSVKTPTGGAPVTSGGTLMDLFEIGKPAEILNDSTTPTTAAPVAGGSTTTRSEGTVLSSLDRADVMNSDRDDSKTVGIISGGGTVGKSSGGFFNRFRRKSGSHTAAGNKSTRTKVELIKPQKTGPAGYDYARSGGFGDGGVMDPYEPNYEPMILACRSVSSVDCIPTASHVVTDLSAPSADEPIDSPEPPPLVESEIVSEVMEPRHNGGSNEPNNNSSSKVSHALADGLNVALASGCPNGLSEAGSLGADPYGFFRKRSLSGFLKGKMKKKSKSKDDKGSADKLEALDKDSEDFEVDEEGFRVKKLSDPPDGNKSNYNSSSDESGDEHDNSAYKKIFVKIKPVDEMGNKEKCASTDELREALDKINRQTESAKRTDPWSNRVPKSNTTADGLGDSSWNGSNLAAYSFTDQTPFGANNAAANASFGGFSNRPNYIRPSYTGGSIASEKSDYGALKNLTQISEDGDSIFPPPLPTMGPPAVPARPRPRSTTPTHMLNISAPPSLPKRGQTVVGNSHFTQKVNMTLPSWTSDQKSRLHNLSQSESIGSMEDLTGSRGPSPLGIGFADSVPIAMAVTETFHAVFKGYDDTRCKIKIVGTLTVSFPSGIVSVLTTNSHPPPLMFQMINIEKILPDIKPNLLLLAENTHLKSDTDRTFEFNMSSLCNHLKLLSDANSNASYYNVNVLQYEVATSSATYDLPLQLVCFWKCESGHTDIRVDYKYGPSGLVTAPLLNLSFIVPVDGGVQDFTSEPQSVWNSEKSQLVWRLTELSRHGDTSGSLKARLKVTAGPSHPKPLAATFQVNDMCLSSSEIQLIGSGYRISLLKRKMVSGKYTCEPEMR